MRQLIMKKIKIIRFNQHALLTIYDMCKAVDKGMELGEIHLVEKTGGKSGHYIRAEGGYV